MTCALPIVRLIPRLARFGSRLSRTVFGVVAALVVLTPLALAAQERPQGVSLTLEYAPGRRIALMVLPVVGPAGDSLKTILERDFDFSDRFQHVPAVAAPEFGAPMNYALLERAGAAGVVQAQLLPSGWLRVLLHDVAGKKVMNQQDFPLPAAVNTDGWRLGVHSIADQVEQWITGEKGIAATRLAYTREGQVWVVDSDGANARAVTPRGLSAAWHPSGRYVVYNVLDDANGIIRLSISDLVTGAQRSLTNEKGANDLTPAISPDGRSVVFSRSVESSASASDLYLIPFEGGRTSRITVARGSINMAPDWSPDGRRVTFMSDRSGRNEIYITDADGTNVSLLTADAYGERNLRASPNWSPDGRSIAYSSRIGSSQQILSINLRDRAVRQVTSDGRNDNPSWAPDGRHLVFSSTRGGTEQLWVVDTESGRMRQVTRGSSARLAAWSPRLAITPP